MSSRSASIALADTSFYNGVAPARHRDTPVGSTGTQKLLTTPQKVRRIQHPSLTTAPSRSDREICEMGGHLVVYNL